MAHIILTSLTRAPEYTRTHAQAGRTVHTRTMTMQRKQIGTDKEGNPVYLKNIDALTPTEPMVKGHKHFDGDTRFASWPKVSDQQYHDQYLAIVEENMDAIKQWYNSIPDDVTIILCCYCAKGKFCHRQYVAQLFEWLNRKPDMKQHEVVLD